ncbi:MAG: Iron hydrogenase 1 [Firmicutes bacterium]|nr:Iron hydrogenase 1 [candidate division NPL-UPA2 bacterium]
MSRRNSETTGIKRQLYTALADMTWRGQLAAEINDYPDTLTAELSTRYRCCEYKEKAVLTHRLRVAMGLAPEDVPRHATLADMAKIALSRTPKPKQCGLEMMAVACDRCPFEKYIVTDVCRNCIAHHCRVTCPKDAITIVNHRAYIDRSRCVECGLCERSCPFRAIIQVTRPCEQACVPKAIVRDGNNVARIDCEKCVGCAACIPACPFGSVADYTSIVQVVSALKEGRSPVVALVAPSFVGQFGTKASPSALRLALLEIGFTHVHEVAQAARQVAEDEAAEIKHRMSEGKPLTLSSCCPSFVATVKTQFPQLEECISTTPSPMAHQATQVKAANPAAITVFIGPCVAKKSEASLLPDVDAVLTFEEVGCIFVARGINIATLSGNGTLGEGDTLGRGFAKAGGLTKAVKAALGEAEIATHLANGLDEVLQTLTKAKKGELNANFVEGMACSGGCIGGHGTLVNRQVTEKLLDRYCEA